MRLRQEFFSMSGSRSPVREVVAELVGEVTSLPGCPVVGVSHAVYRMSGRSGYGRAAFRRRAEQMRELGYVVMLCTVVETNAPQVSILLNEGAFLVTTFKNPQTGHKVAMYCYHLIGDLS